MKIAIVIPCYQEAILPDEQISLNYLERHLSAYTRISIQPETLSPFLPGCETVHFADEYFTGVDSYSRLLLSPIFYETFISFEYILIYQLDCLVFSKDLQSWCALGYDYIGAPLFEKNTQPPRLSRVGNGGLSLRRVQACLDVLQSRDIPSWGTSFAARLPDINQFSFPASWLKKFRTIRDARRGVEWYARNYSLNEDLFWSDRARLFHPDFRIAPLDVALRFAFDAHPQTCFQQNGGQLPFGAHAWAKWDRAFWEKNMQVLEA